VVSAFFEEFLRVGVYKRSQGRIVRQVTFGAIAVAILVGLWRMSTLLLSYTSSIPAWVGYLVPGVLAVVGLWAAYRVVNMPVFADFLITVEVEVNKVSWPSVSETWRWTLVVIVMIVTIGMLLWVFDAIWIKVFQWIGVYGGKSP
jgi:preprotein translocase subunit SecE